MGIFIIKRRKRVTIKRSVIIEFGDFEYDDEYVDSFVVTLAKAELVPIRFNACDDKMCTAPEVWSYSKAVLQRV